MNDLEKRIEELEDKVGALEKENDKLKNETVEVVAAKLLELNGQLQQFQKDTIDSCLENIIQLLKQKGII